MSSQGTEAIEGLTLKLQLTSRGCFNTSVFKKMQRLRLLQLDHVNLTEDYRYLPKQLRWIYWKRFPLNYIPHDFYLGRVIAIDLRHSNLRLVWKEPQVYITGQFLLKLMLNRIVIVSSYHLVVGFSVDESPQS